MVGREFSTGTVAAALGEPRDRVDERCETLAARGLVLLPAAIADRRPAAVAGRYGFLHALYQQVLYERLAPARRVRLHRGIGEIEESAYGARVQEHAAELALHFERGHEHRRALHHLELAARNAVRQARPPRGRSTARPGARHSPAPPGRHRGRAGGAPAADGARDVAVHDQRIRGAGGRARIRACARALPAHGRQPRAGVRARRTLPVLLQPGEGPARPRGRGPGPAPGGSPRSLVARGRAQPDGTAAAEPRGVRHGPRASRAGDRALRHGAAPLDRDAACRRPCADGARIPRHYPVVARLP